MSRFFLMPILILVVLLIEFRQAIASPLEPQAALADFQLPPGYCIELVAVEPQVVDPIAIAFDEDGRLWVVEMRDYPTLPTGARPTSRIRILQDRDGDGRYETASTFADNLLFPTGLQPWRGGAIVTLAGRIAYFPDDNRDNRADRQETWYEGFATDNEQLRANHPQLAADGWVYVAGGLRGGTIRNLRLPDAPEISINGRDFAFHPVTGECRAATGNGQFGLAFDDFGRRFTCSNRNPLVQVMIAQRYLEQNPALVLPQAVHDVAAAGADSRLYPRTRAMTTALEHAGQFTAACGVEIARGDAFICEPTANLVHRELLTPDGAAFTSRPARDGVEFLSSTDEWFRPVNLYTGPDGALYVVDMYRAVIEHPEWMPEEWRDRADLRDGSDRGRIYRIVAAGAEPRRSSQLQIKARDPAELVRLLEHPNSWQRETAARLLLEQSEPAAIAPLIDLAKNCPNAVGRYHALAALETLDALTESLLLRALEDESPGVRELALRQAETRLADSAALAEQVLSMANDGDPRVRFQAALSLALLPADMAASALTAITTSSPDDRWIRRAVALAARDEATAIVERLLTTHADSATAAVSIESLQELIEAVASSGEPGQVASILAHADSLGAADARRLVLLVATAWDEQQQPFSAPLDLLAKRRPAARRRIDKLFDAALSKLSDGAASPAERIAAAVLLRFDARAETLETLLQAAEEQSTPAVQVAAARALRGRRDPTIAVRLLASFPSQLPSVRQTVLDLLAASPRSAIGLLHAVADNQIAISDLGASRAQSLLTHADPAVRDLAEEVIGAHAEDRAAVVEQYQASLRLKGDAVRGKQVFLAACSSCHRIAHQGTAIGPDIGDAALKPPAQLLTDILDPNQAIDANYVSYTALTLDGLAHQGVIRSETASGLILRTAEGRTVTLHRDDLESLSGGGSLMPEGLERQITVQQMADLLTFLKTWRQAADLF